MKQATISRDAVRRGERTVDRQALEDSLRESVSGDVRFDDGTRALYATDSSNYRQVPIGVVFPHNRDDVIATVSACRQHNAPLLSRGGGTSLAGQTCNVAVIMDFSRHMNRILELDPVKKSARVEPGIVLDDLRHAAGQHQLTFGPDPATHNRCTLGGMIGNDSCGVHSLKWGKTVDNVKELSILTYDGRAMRVSQTGNGELGRLLAKGDRIGEIYASLASLRDRSASLIRREFPKIPRRVSGYNLDQLLEENGFNVAGAMVGSESTCVTVLEATVRLVATPAARVVVALAYPDVANAADHIPELLSFGPIGLEGYDDRLVEDCRKKNLRPDAIKRLPNGGGFVLVEFGGESREAAADTARRFMHSLQRSAASPDMRLFIEEEDQKMAWEVREAALGATAVVPNEPRTWPGWEDSAVPPDRLGDYLRELRKLLDRYQYGCSFYGHFGQGCLHTRIDFDFHSDAGRAKFRSFLNEAADLVISMGGSLSGEHGDGQARAELIHKMYSPELMAAFRDFKAIWDPRGMMNPGKMVDANPVDADLRLGSGYRPARVTTRFHYPQDEGSFAKAALRCVGVGECRREGGGTMCPSYMVTREEKHSTRGRARLLFEMLQGNPLRGGWRSEEVHEALDLCLACKGCKGDCPVNVDMATYKAEFLSHYFAGRLRPRSAYAFGLIYWWAGIAARFPSLVNFTTQAPLLSSLAKLAAGIAPQRRIPRFAPETFRHWFSSHGGRVDGPPVLLWPDTFNNHFHPRTAIAAVQVLEAAGFRVRIPEQILCCGRPLYDFGMLGLAKRLLGQILDSLRPDIRAGVPIVGLEPSCVSVFRDELINFFPEDADARRLSQQCMLLSEFLEKKAPDFQLPRLRGKAIVHGHCHHKALMKMTDEERVLGRMGVSYELLDSGCCGMAGAFGFEKGDHYEVSIKAGERVLLPAVRKATADTMVIADGFSCREQVTQAAGRTPVHLAEGIQLALDETNKEQGRPAGSARDYPSAPWRAGVRRRRFALLAGLAGLGLFLLSRRRRRLSV